MRVIFPQSAFAGAGNFVAAGRLPGLACDEAASAVGKQAFPVSRLKLLAEFLDYPLDDILPYVTHPNRVTPESTKSALAMYGLSGYIPR